jgi:hypothetical protein
VRPGFYCRAFSASSQRKVKPRYDPLAMSDVWPPSGPRKRPPTLEHIQDLWTLRGIKVKSNVVAAV